MNVLGVGLIGGMKQRAGFARAGVSFENPDGLAGIGKLGLLCGPGGGTIVLLADFGDGDGEIVGGEMVGRQGGMIVVMTDVTQEKGSTRSIKVFHRQCAIWRPPGVKLGASCPAQSRSPPSFVLALRALEM